jgi:asparagine N-glycosylation enzyme membrane subunit Stt3
MKSYLITTGFLFLALVGAHVARAVQERDLARDPWFVVTTILSIALAVWAWRLYRRLPAAP